VIGVALALLLVVGLAACGDEPRDGDVVVAEGDTYGEWELTAGYTNGEWNGCLSIDVDDVEHCGDPNSDELQRWEAGDGVVIGAVPEGATLAFADGDDVELIDDRFFVVASDAEIQLG